MPQTARSGNFPPELFPPVMAELKQRPRRGGGRPGGWLGAFTVAALAWGGTLLGASRPPVFPALDLGWEHFDPGERLLAELHCTACHSPEPAVADRLQTPPAPDLRRAGARLRPEFLRAWLADPLTTKPGTTMPDVLGALAPVERAGAGEELVHYLVSLSPESVPVVPPAGGALAVQQGRVLYHQVGCVACHAPFEPAASVFPQSVGAPTDPDALRYTLARLEVTSPALPDLAAKYRPGALAEFLADPLAVRPAGRMPSLNLTEAEARALAAYLNRATAKPSSPAETVAFRVDPAKARRGRERFAELGCAACHDLGEGQPAVSTFLKAPPLVALQPDAPTGCLAAAPGPRAPRYGLSSEQREALRATLRQHERLRRPATPAERVTHTLVALNCTACHSRDGLGGPPPSRADYFTSLTEADLGDEGRLPPHLSGVGHKLRADWLGQVLTNRAAVRPYLAVRMPQFSAANVGALAAHLRAADAWSNAPPERAGDVAAGRLLVGVGGYGCVQCHRWGPYAALGTSVMDLTRMAERLEWPWFHAYLLDPPGLRPGTRMPVFWPEGRATVPGILEGDTERQIAAIWAYLRQGAEAEPPPGLVEGRPATPGPVPDYE